MKYFVLYILPITLILLLACSRGKGSSSSNDDSYNGEIIGTIPNATDTITIDRFIGANGFIDDPVDKMAAVGFIREYHNWFWNEGNGDKSYVGFPNNQIQYAPSFPGWDFDQYYADLKKQNIMVAPCLQNSVDWLQGYTNFAQSQKPIDQANLNTSDPFSYHAKASFMYQYAARYGSTKVADNMLLVAANQSRLSGLGYIRYIEDWNEQDRSWEGPKAEFSPEEYAAMASADYDGHCNEMNKLGKKYGAKNADSSIRFVMGGLTSLNVDYIKKMKLWFEKNRKDRQFAADVLNFHIYAFKDGKSWQGGGPAISPEDAGFREKLANVVKYRNENLPTKEVWVSEFGWDTNPESVLCPPSIGNMDTYEVQGIWLVRAYLAFAAAGVDRAQMYMIRDANSNDKTWFASSGLIGQKGNFSPKKSWYYVYTMKNLLKNMRYSGAVATTDPHILVYKFKDIHSSKGAYVVWAKTSSNYSVSQYPLSISAKAQKANLISLVPNLINGDSSSLTIKDQKTYIDVSEKPTFILVDAID